MKRLHSAEGILAQKITELAGSMMFVYLHVLWFSGWLLANNGWLRPYVPIFDPFPHGLLTTVVSLEAIFLSAFILVAQNRQALIDTVRDIEEDIEEEEDEREIEELQKDLEEIKKITASIRQKISEQVLSNKGKSASGNP
jgi:uncharacterized membrane protein